MRQRIGYACVILCCAIFALPSGVAFSADKSGVDPQVISLPDGPGSIQGLGESFEPNLNTGTASYAVKIAVCPGVNGFAPELSLNYDSGFGNGIIGIGWRLSTPSIQRQTDKGLPRFADGDRFTYGEAGELVPLENSFFRLKIEGAFTRCRRMADHWQAWEKGGTRHFFGETAAARVETSRGTFKWLLERSIDNNGNEIRYLYFKDGGRCYLQEVRYAFAEGGQAYRSVSFDYTDRGDIVRDYRSRTLITMAKRLGSITISSQGSLVRKYVLGYDTAPGTSLSRLRTITQLGADGSTTLPTLAFDYSSPDFSAAAISSIANPPQTSLSDPETDLVDIDGDGLPDVLHTPVSGHQYYMNAGNGSFFETALEPVTSASQNLSSNGVWMGDLDGNGLADLLVQSVYQFGYFRNTGRPWEEELDWVDYGAAPPFSMENAETRLVDLNNDGLMDVIFSAQTEFRVYMNNGTDPWAEEFPPPANPGVAFSSSHIRFADMNGDGMQDIVHLDTAGDSYYLPNMGFGEFGGEIFMTGSPPISEAKLQDGTLLLMDANSDGLADLVQVDSEEVTVWLNACNDAFATPTILTGTPGYFLTPPALRQADMDGNGSPDLVFSFAGAGLDERYQYLDFTNGTRPNLLTRIDNGLGRVVAIDYQSSVRDYLEAAASGSPWQMKLPFPVLVVNRRTVSDKNSGQDYVTIYTYRDGHYDGAEREFRGFAQVDQTECGEEDAPTLVTRHVFDTGREEESRKGMLLEKAALKENGTVDPPSGIFQRTLYELQTLALATGTNGESVRYSYISNENRILYEDTELPLQTLTAFQQDNYGNTTAEFNYGLVDGDDLGAGADEIFTTSTFLHTIDDDTWRVDRPSRVTQTALDGSFVSDTRNTYDAKGNLTLQEKAVAPGQWVRIVENTYDSYGNAVLIKDANGHTRSMAYDDVFHTFPVSETLDQLGLSMSATYNAGFGTVASFTDFNEHTTLFEYDVLGRISKIVKPGDTLDLPTQAFEYHLADPVSHVITHQREISGHDGTYDTCSYYDGLGRKLQTRSEAEDGNWVVAEAAVFNQRGLEKKKWLPYFAGYPGYAPPDPAEAAVQSAYDAMGRLVSATQPDGSYALDEYLPLKKIHWDEEDTADEGPHAGTPTTYFYDGLERLTRVDAAQGEQTYTTRYTYDGLGNVVRILDDQGNLKTMDYDGLGRKTSMVDPDKGAMEYQYDGVGNLLATLDAKGQNVTYTYDPANRILTENFDGVKVRYHYDSDAWVAGPPASNTLGRLAWVEDEAGIVSFSYDARGNMTAKTREAAGYRFVLGMEYDAMDRLSRLIYPDGHTVSYEYNAMNQLECLPGYASDIDYHPSGQKTLFAHANGLNSSYTYDARQRLTRMATAHGDRTLQDLSYAYDRTGNILSITDGRGNPTPESLSRIFVYDDLYRLTACNAPAWQISYAYDSIGNLVSKTSDVGDPKVNLGVLTYGEGSAGPHAVTNAGAWQYDYDANGNLESKTGQTFTFDHKDRMRLTANQGAGSNAEYTYDYEGNRVIKTVSQGGETDTTLYIDRFAEVRGSSLVEHVFAGNRRVAQIIKPFDPTALINSPQVLDAEDLDADTDGVISLEEIRAQGNDPDVCELGEVRDALAVFKAHMNSNPSPLTFQTMAAACTSLSIEPVPGEVRTYFYIPDHLGSASIVTDAWGDVVEESVYYPYGMNRTRTGSFEADYRFTGKELDNETDLHYFGARYYDAMVGRFVSVDPLLVGKSTDLSGSSDLENYSYVISNPVRFSDPSGLKEKDHVDWAGYGEKYTDKVLIKAIQGPNLKVVHVSPPGFGGGNYFSRFYKAKLRGGYSRRVPNSVKIGPFFEIAGDLASIGNSVYKRDHLGMIESSINLLLDTAQYSNILDNSYTQLMSGKTAKGLGMLGTAVFGGIREFSDRGYSLSDVADAFSPSSIAANISFAAENPDALINASIEGLTSMSAVALKTATGGWVDVKGTDIQKGIEKSVDAAFDLFF